MSAGPMQPAQTHAPLIGAGDAPGGAPPTVGGEVVSEFREVGSFKRAFLTFSENRIALASVVVVVVLVLFCFLGPLIYHTDQSTSNVINSNLRPGGSHLLGTDENGFDILGRLMAGGQSALEIGVAVAIVATSIGVLWGAIAGYIGGLLDSVMMRVVDTLLAVPTIVVFIFLASVVKPTIPLLILVLALLSWLTPARLVRGETLSLRTREYVEASRVLGGGRMRAVVRHIIPNTIGTIIVNATFQVADAILALAVLSFLGFGPPPPTATWGEMLSNGTTYLFDGYWWEVYPAGVMIVITVLCFNFIGDGLRDSFEVRLQRR
jgi:peptide/nickel transport system permease protein